MKNWLTTILIIICVTSVQANEPILTYEFSCRNATTQNVNGSHLFKLVNYQGTVTSITWKIDNSPIETVTYSLSPGSTYYWTNDLIGTHTVTAEVNGDSYSITANFIDDQGFNNLSIAYTESGGVYTFTYQGSSNLSVYGNDAVLIIDGVSTAVDLSTVTGAGNPIGTYTFSSVGQHEVKFEYCILPRSHPDTKCCEAILSIKVNSVPFIPDPCCSNFAPIPEDRYWISAWVREDHPSQVKSYTNARIEIEFIGGATSFVNFYPTGNIIDGWQRIVGDFVVPSGSTDLKLHLVNESDNIQAYFDDVRVHPFHASMKSYVYDPETLWLTAELDDNNYATFYEYDKEGQLIRIKKETARGIMTIQESRSSNPKK